MHIYRHPNVAVDWVFIVVSCRCTEPRYSRTVLHQSCNFRIHHNTPCCIVQTYCCNWSLSGCPCFPGCSSYIQLCEWTNGRNEPLFSPWYCQHPGQEWNRDSRKHPFHFGRMFRISWSFHILHSIILHSYRQFWR